MTESVIDLSDRLFAGNLQPREFHPMATTGEVAEISESIAFIPSFANVTALKTRDGLILVDTGSPMFAVNAHAELRRWSPDLLHTAIWTHGHIDHVFGIPIYESENAEAGVAAPIVVSHAGVPRRFDRYVLTAGYNASINARQFGIEGLKWPVDYRFPDVTFRRSHQIELGDLRLELRHFRGETDDHAFVWAPREKVLCCGDFFIWASPNAGNPQKVQRYPKDWADALRAMIALEPLVLLPGHGLPILGRDRIAAALGDAAEFLESLHDQTVEMMNQGATLDEILHTVAPPPHLLDKPYLRPIYDEPEFVVRNVWRYYGGWFDGRPSSLKPARNEELAREIADLAGGPGILAGRARELAREGNSRLACHIADFAADAAPDDPAIHAARAAVYDSRIEGETSTMAKGIFSWAARESREKTEE